jgi:hypothetical protein
MSRDGAAVNSRSCAVNPPKVGARRVFGMRFAYANGVPEKKEKKLVQTLDTSRSIEYTWDMTSDQRRTKMISFARDIQVEETYLYDILYASECCGEYMTREEVEYSICPKCKEHCDVVVEEYFFPR